MPCSDSLTWEREETASHINNLTRLLCIQCKFNEKHGYAKHPEVENWFTAHKTADAERRRGHEQEIERLKSELERVQAVKPSTFHSEWVKNEKIKSLKAKLEYFNEQLTEDSI